MMTDPYKELGVSRETSNDDVKKAYRELSRKYHPDANVNNPLSDLASEKFKDVQAAYDQIMKEREGGYSGSYGSNTSYGRPEGSGDSPELNTVYSYLSARRYREALNTLNNISNHSAKWYYYSAIANAQTGNNFVALNHAREAVNMEPNNVEYRNLLNQMDWQGKRYDNTRQQGGYGGYGSGCGSGNFCCDLCVADSLCECMGGDLCGCF